MSIYLDNAATSFPKPETVYRAVEHALRVIGSGPGRGGYRSAIEATRLVFEAREAAAAFFGVSDSSRVVFTHSATESLNLALLGFLKPGDHVVTSTMEHNSLARPLRLMEERGVTVTRVSCSQAGGISAEELEKSLRAETRLVALSHCSNVSGYIQPIEEIGPMVRRHGARLLVDAAQSAGEIPVDVEKQCIDLLAVPGHKGLLVPQGTGLLYVAEDISLEPLMVGGTGGHSTSHDQPVAMPERYESGTQNTPGIAGLKAGIEFISERGVLSIRRHVAGLLEQLLEGLHALERVTVYGPEELERRGGLVSFTVDGVDPSAIGFALDRDYDIAVRVGLHCAPDAHRTIGTFPTGTVRVSPGVFTTPKEIDAFLVALRAVIGE